MPTFDPRTAAQFWGIDDWSLALRMHAIVGGTPAYRREYVRNDAPASRADLDRWVIQRVLQPASPLHKEARYLLAEEGDIRDPALYHSVLGAIAAGHTTRGAMSIMRPEWFRLQRPDAAAQVWTQARERFTRKVLGPHFEQLCRWWTANHSAGETLGGRPARVASGVINDPRGKATHELDVVGVDPDGRILCLGEAKLATVMNAGHLDRLRRARRLLESAGHDVARTRLLCFSAAGFEPDLRAAASEGEAVLVDLDRIYTGS